MLLGPVAVPLLHISPGPEQLAPDEGLDAHPGLRVAEPLGIGQVGPFWIFAQGELERPESLGDDHVFRRPAPFQGEDDVLSADGVGAAVHGMNHGHPAAQGGEDGQVLGVEDVGHIHFGRVRIGRLVGAAEGDMSVGVDDSRDDVFPRSVVGPDAGRSFQAGPYGSDDPVPDKDVSPVQDAAGHGQDFTVPDQQVAALGQSGSRDQAQQGQQENNPACLHRPLLTLWAPWSDGPLRCPWERPATPR